MQTRNNISKMYEKCWTSLGICSDSSRM